MVELMRVTGGFHSVEDMVVRVTHADVMNTLAHPSLYPLISTSCRPLSVFLVGMQSARRTE